jgi:two-component system OmpR family response regulator
MEGYQAVVAGDGLAGLDAFQSADPPFDLIVLDLMLPGMSGYETCRAIRTLNQDVPILVLSARTLSEDRVQAFDCGTDQYMTKPFALPELLSRVRNLTERRSVRASTSGGGESTKRSPAMFQFGDVTVDFARFELTVGAVTHNLTKMELDLLRYFIVHEGRVLSRAEIMERVWGESPQISTRSIDNFVMRLRKLIEPDPAEPRHLLSVRGAGYRFVARPETPGGAE